MDIFDNEDADDTEEHSNEVKRPASTWTAVEQWGKWKQSVKKSRKADFLREKPLRVAKRPVTNRIKRQNNP